MATWTRLFTVTLIVVCLAWLPSMMRGRWLVPMDMSTQPTPRNGARTLGRRYRPVRLLCVYRGAPLDPRHLGLGGARLGSMKSALPNLMKLLALDSLPSTAPNVTVWLVPRWLEERIYLLMPVANMVAVRCPLGLYRQ